MNVGHEARIKSSPVGRGNSIPLVKRFLRSSSWEIVVVSDGPQSSLNNPHEYSIILEVTGLTLLLCTAYLNVGKKLNQAHAIVK